MGWNTRCGSNSNFVTRSFERCSIVILANLERSFTVLFYLSRIKIMVRDSSEKLKCLGYFFSKEPNPELFEAFTGCNRFLILLTVPAQTLSSNQDSPRKCLRPSELPEFGRIAIDGL